MKNYGYMKQISDAVKRERKLAEKEIAYQERQKLYKEKMKNKEESEK